MLTIKESDYNSILDYCNRHLPEEACGLLAGYRNEGMTVVEKVYFITNTDHSDVHFSMEPKEMFDAARDMRANGYMLVGNFHSHTDSPAIFSAEDRRLAYDLEISYLIVSMQDINYPKAISYKFDNYNNINVEELCII